MTFGPRSMGVMGLFLASVSPLTALAALPDTATLCAQGESDPASFLATYELDQVADAMSEACPMVLFPLFDLTTGSIPTGTPGGSGSGAGGTNFANLPTPPQPGVTDNTELPPAPDYSRLISALNTATDELNAATSAVEGAQQELDAAIKGVQDSGATATVRAFTEEQKDALQRLKDARAELKSAQETFDAAVKSVNDRLNAAFTTARSNLDAYLGDKGVDPAKLDAFIASLDEAVGKAGEALDGASKAAEGARNTANTALNAIAARFNLSIGEQPDVALDGFHAKLSADIAKIETDLGKLKSDITRLSQEKTARDSEKAQADQARFDADALVTRRTNELATAEQQLRTAQAALKAELDDETKDERNSVLDRVRQANNSCTSSGGSSNNCSIRPYVNFTPDDFLTLKQTNPTAFGSLPSSVQTAVNRLESERTKELNELRKEEKQLFTAIDTAQTRVNTATTNLTNARSEATRLAAAYTTAVAAYDAAVKALADAMKLQEGIEEKLRTLNGDLSAFKDLSEQLAAAKQAVADAEAKLAEAEALSKAAKEARDQELAALEPFANSLTEAEEALKNSASIIGDETSEEAKAVAAARDELAEALKAAKAAADLGEGEAEALAAVQKAKEALDAAVKAQQTEVAEAEDLLETVPQPAPAPAVEEAVEDLTDAVDTAENTAPGAQDQSDAAAQDLEDHATSVNDLNDEIASVEAEQSASADAGSRSDTSSSESSSSESQSSENSSSESQSSESTSSEGGTDAGV